MGRERDDRKEEEERKRDDKKGGMKKGSGDADEPLYQDRCQLRR